MGDSIQVIILGAGNGFRLRPLSFYRPKCLLPIANRRLLELILEDLAAAGFRDASVVLPAMQDVGRLAEESAPPGLSVEAVIPPRAASGSVDAVARALRPDAETALVVYGDSLISADFRALAEAHRIARDKGAMATILYHRPEDLAVPEKDGRTYHGVMSVGEEGLVTRFEEKPAVADIGRGFDKANAAVFCIEREALVAAIDGGARDFSRDVFEPGVTSGMPVYGIDIGSGYRFDVGGISRWYELNMRALRGELRFARPGREIAPGAWLGERSEAAGSSLLPSCLIGDGVEVSEGSTIGPDAIIGNGCRIGRGSRIARSIVMEGCEIGSDAVIEESVIGPSCAIEAGSRIPPRTILGPYSSYGGNSWRNLARSPEYRYG